MKRLLPRTIPFLLCVISIIAASGCFPTEEVAVLEQQTGKGWRVWVKTSPCAGGRTDWLTVSQNNPTGGGKFFDAIDLLDSSATCRQAAPNGCTFQQANAEKERFKNSERFKDYCCQDYSVWQNTRTGELAAVKGAFATAGDGWQFEDGPMCCEEAEEITGKKGLCGGAQTGGNTKVGGSTKTGGTTGYIGCFKDTSDFDLNGFLQRSRSNTPEACIAICRAKGFKYAGVQYGESCLCGDSYGKYGAADNCDYKCTGDSGKICGGSNANSVYGTGAGGEESSAEIDLSGNWAAVVDTSYGKFDYAMTLKRAAAGKWTGTHTSTLNGQSPATDAVIIESLGGGKMTFTLRPGKPNVQSFEGSYTKDQIIMNGYGGQLLFTRR